MALAMTGVQVTSLIHHTDGIRELYIELENKHRDEWGDGTNPNLTLALEVSALKTAVKYLDMTYDHHKKEGW